MLKMQSAWHSIARKKPQDLLPAFKLNPAEAHEAFLLLLSTKVTMMLSVAKPGLSVL